MVMEIDWKRKSAGLQGQLLDGDERSYVTDYEMLIWICLDNDFGFSENFPKLHGVYDDGVRPSYQLN